LGFSFSSSLESKQEKQPIPISSSATRRSTQSVKASSPNPIQSKVVERINLRNKVVGRRRRRRREEEEEEEERVWVVWLSAYKLS